MNSNNFTQNSIQAINKAEQLARENGNSELGCLHLLSALLESDGLNFRILKGCGIDAFYASSAGSRTTRQSCTG